MPLAEQPQHLSALRHAQAVRLDRAAQRVALRNARPGVIAAALIDPPPKLASYRLRDLFGRCTIVVGFGPARLAAALRSIEWKHPLGRRWSDALRLRDLTRGERQWLAMAISRRAWAKGENDD